MRTKILFISIVTILVFVASPVGAQEQQIVDGDLVKTDSNPDVYIVKLVGEKKFKRLILNPDIFESYGHLRWDAIKTISEEEIDTFKVSELVIEVNSDGSVADPKIYRISSDEGSDVGERAWLDITAEEFEQAGYDWDSIYHVNHTEASPAFYPTSDPLDFETIIQDLLIVTAEILFDSGSTTYDMGLVDGTVHLGWWEVVVPMQGYIRGVNFVALANNGDTSRVEPRFGNSAETVGGEQTYKVSSTSSPYFLQAIFNPFDATNGELMTIKAQIRRE